MPKAIGSRAAAFGSATVARAQRLDVGYRGIRSVFEEEGTSLTFENLLASLVAAVRTDKDEEDRSGRDVFKIARSRCRRLGLLSLGTGPLRGMASQVIELYCETAIVCDVADLHAIELTHREVAGHMLTLWEVLDDLDEAQAVMAGTGSRSLRSTVGQRLGAGVAARLPDEPTMHAAMKALWDARNIAGGVRNATPGSIRTIVFPGGRTKQLIKKAEAQLGVESS